MAEERFQVRPMVPLTFMYNYHVGAFMERFIQGLSDKKILGVSCPECKRVLVPPRSACGQCSAKPDAWVEVQPEGVLENFTVAHVTIEQGQVKDLDAPEIIGMIRLNGADSLLAAKIRGISPEACKAGLRVRAVWKDPPEGTVLDLEHFEPVE